MSQPEGGIVDNGRTPGQDSGDNSDRDNNKSEQPDVQSDSPGPSGSMTNPTYILRDILAQRYVASLPSNFSSPNSTSAFDSFTDSNDETKTVQFKVASSLCQANSDETNEYNFQVYRCGTGHLQLSLVGSEIIDVTFNSLSDSDVEELIQSFNQH